MGKVFFTSDLHFGHESSILFDKRGFKTVEEMDEELIRRWNAKVGKGDLVYVIGDFIWKSYYEEAKNLIKRLNGQIILIKGNHDKFLVNSAAKKALAGIKEKDDICVTLEDGTKRRCILNHHYTPFYDGFRYGAIHLHGHSHLSKEAEYERFITEGLRLAGFNVEIYNVGCMYWNYEPVTLDEILAAHRKVLKPSYKKLFFHLIDIDMSKSELAQKAEISQSTISKMARGFKVSDETVRKIANTLNCKVEDIMEYVEVTDGKKQSQ